MSRRAPYVSDQTSQREWLFYVEDTLVFGVRRDLSGDDEAWAEQGIRVDRLSERVERIERRLKISE